MVYIEFIGIPGSGKSAIADALVKKLQQQYGKEFLTKDEAFCTVSRLNIDKCYRWLLNLVPWKLALYLSEKLENRSVMQFDALNRFLSEYGHSFKVYLSSDEFSRASRINRKNSISFFLAMGSAYQEIADCLDSKKNRVFFAEGFLQKSSMFILPNKECGVNSRILREYLSNIPHPDILIHVKAGAAVCLSRMKKRSRGVPLRLKQLEDEEIQTYLRKADNHFVTVTKYLEEKYQVNVIEIENNLPLDTVIESAAGLLTKYLEI